jgi:hypothetical protein
MRLVLGIILGVLLTIGVAYVSDSGRAAVCQAGGVGCPLVNWDEANTRYKNAETSIRGAWDRLTGHQHD